MFDIYEGESFGLLGPNGAGKSTLVNQVAGLRSPTAGSIRLYGMDVVKEPDLAPTPTWRMRSEPYWLVISARNSRMMF